MSQIIPVTIVDDFFENPDDVVNFANSLSYGIDTEQHVWPGKRSKPLHLENKNFYTIFCYKFFSLYFDVENDTSFRWESDLVFQKIGSSYVNGWTHKDMPNIITAIVYLNKNSNPNSGTTIMSKNNLCVTIEEKLKRDFFKTTEKTIEIEQAKINNEKQFNESITIQNKYNRLIAFESHLWHKAQDYSLPDNEERLTLIMFVNKLYTSHSPMKNMRNYII